MIANGKIDFDHIIQRSYVWERKRKSALIESMIHDTHLTLVENKEKTVAKKLYTETHMISLVPFFEKALEVGIEVNTMADWLIDFFGSHNEQYDIAAGNGSAKNSNIVVRNTVLAESFEQFFSEV